MCYSTCHEIFTFNLPYTAEEVQHKSTQLQVQYDNEISSYHHLRREIISSLFLPLQSQNTNIICSNPSYYRPMPLSLSYTPFEYFFSFTILQTSLLLIILAHYLFYCLNKNTLSFSLSPFSFSLPQFHSLFVHFICGLLCSIPSRRKVLLRICCRHKIT